MYMSWKKIDSRANTSGSALYAGTVFYNETNHDLEAIGSAHHPHLSCDAIVARNIRATDALTVQKLDGVGPETPYMHVLANQTADSGLPTVEIKGTGLGTTASPYGLALMSRGKVWVREGLDVDGDVTGRGDLSLINGRITAVQAQLMGGTDPIHNTITLTVQAATGGGDHRALDVTGNTSLSGSLGVTGNTSLSGDLGVTGNTSLSGPLGVTGNTSLSGDLNVTGNTSLSGPLGVTGNTSLSGSLNVNTGNLTVTGGSITTNESIDATDTITGGLLVSKGDVTCFSTSDRRLKEDIRQIENAGETIDKLRGVRYKWRDEWFKENEVILAHQDDIGFIAQEVEEVVPEMVSEKGNGYKGISYHKLVPLLLEAVKDLRQDVRRLEGEIKEIRANHD